MALPKQAQQQVKRANEILEALSKPPKPEQEQEEKQPELKTVEAEAKPEPEVKPEVKPEEKPEPDKAEAPAKPESEPEVQPEPKPSDDFEHKYKVLKGKYDSEVPRLSRQVADLNAELGTLRDTLAALQTREETPNIDSSITPEEIEEYGSDLIDLIGKKAREISSGEVSRLQAEIADLKGQLGGVTRSVVGDARERMFSQLDSDVENWRELNQDSSFLDWLDLIDPYSGEQRGRMLQEAYEANDGPRVVAFFKGFLNENAAITPTATADSVQKEPRTPAVDLKEQVAPGKGQRPPGDAGAQKEKRIWTRPDIAAFYADVQKGKFKGKAEQRAALEADIAIAMKEGRIR